MFRVYLDGIEQDESDIININDVAEFTIIREDGFNSGEQIIRDKTEMELQFSGSTYTYICNKIATDKCAEIEFRIEDDESGLFYNGVIPVTLCELQLGKRVGKTKIKDNSFSAYIRDFMDSDVSLFNTKTINCSNLESVSGSFRMKKTYNNDTDVIVITAYDALDVLKYMVNYFTNNTIEVVSTFLTNNKYAITTGFNMHNYAGSSDEIYPNISISTLFDELRKKLRLYMAIEYDISGQPYLRIEQESYFFSNTIPLFSVADLPLDSIQVYDRTRDFDEINTGSTNDEPDDENSPITYPQKRYIAWNNETYNSCGTCTAQRDNILDLVSEFIIDSNIIYEALNWGLTDYGYDSNIFMFNYEVSGSDNVGVRTLLSGNYYYNETLRNDNVLENWIDYYGTCLAVARYPENGFLLDYNNYPLTITGGFGFDGQGSVIEYNNIVYDLETLTSSYTGSALLPSSILGAGGIGVYTFSYFEIPVNGTYNLQDEVVRFLQTSKLTFPTQLDIESQIIVYTDNTFSTVLNVFSVIESTPNAVTTPTSITNQTGEIILSAGNCVSTRLLFKDYSGNIALVGGNFDFVSDNVIFQLISDGKCESIDYNNQNSKPFILTFEYPLCFADYQTAKENKNGYIDVTGKRFWIKELTYRHNRDSTLKLMGNYSLCEC